MPLLLLLLLLLLSAECIACSMIGQIGNWHHTVIYLSVHV